MSMVSLGGESVGGAGESLARRGDGSLGLVGGERLFTGETTLATTFFFYNTTLTSFFFSVLFPS